MSRYVHGSGRDDAQLNNRPQSRFPKIPGLSTAGQSPPVVHTYRSVAVPYAHKVVTEITCRGAGAIGAAIRARALAWGVGAIRRPLPAPPCVYWEKMIDR